jgi:hypothetical protein
VTLLRLLAFYLVNTDRFDKDNPSFTQSEHSKRRSSLRVNNSFFRRGDRGFEPPQSPDNKNKENFGVSGIFVTLACHFGRVMPKTSPNRTKFRRVQLKR